MLRQMLIRPQGGRLRVKLIEGKSSSVVKEEYSLDFD